MSIAPDLLKKVTKVVVHANCADGTLAAAIIRQALPTAQVVQMDYKSRELAELKAEPGLLFADFSPPPERAEEFLREGTLVLDHHKTAQEMLGNFIARGQGVFGDETRNPGISGAVLAFEEVYAPLKGPDASLAHFARLIGIRDTWQKNDPHWDLACRASAGLRALPLEWWLTHKPELTEMIWALGNASIEGRQRQVEETLDNLDFFRDYDGQDHRIHFGVFSDPKGLSSDLAELTRQRDLCDVTLGFFYVREPSAKPNRQFAEAGRNKMKIVVSCRSTDLFDVGAMCKFLGGGGHSRAAGFTIELDDPFKATSPHLQIRMLVENYCRTILRKED